MDDSQFLSNDQLLLGIRDILTRANLPPITDAREVRKTLEELKKNPELFQELMNLLEASKG